MSEDNSSVSLHIKACHSDGRPAGENPQTWSFFMDILRFCNAPLTTRSETEIDSPTVFKPLPDGVQFHGFQALLPLHGAQLTPGSIRWYWAQAGIIAQSLLSVAHVSGLSGWIDPFVEPTRSSPIHSTTMKILYFMSTFQDPIPPYIYYENKEAEPG